MGEAEYSVKNIEFDLSPIFRSVSRPMSLVTPAILYQRRDFAFFTSGRFLSTVAMQI